MGDKGVGKLWWAPTGPLVDNPPEYTLFVGHRASNGLGLSGIGIGRLQYVEGGMEYVHFGDEIPSVLLYEGMAEEEVKVAIETAVRLTCTLGGTQ